ncbi:hypothetical protein CKM354_000288300 [Cercospora kikuchii]|uniref:O-methyltransferase C-terminal domain-containing protein n=1 Tax=Cercospora kikuchii TaxID=84275 RepID=A0A9P3CD76_9PEZI|nr:uncharacterized protein CKM354_000288300 [Cercospora kikuchii]GIZ39501.1 hypothetical protein CKM354_000288300 [Cercospora kikuchii]
MSTLATPPITPGTEKKNSFDQPADPNSLINELSRLKISISKGDNAAKTRALALSRQLTASLTEPVDAASSMIFQPFISFAVQTAVRLDVFPRLIQQQAKQDNKAISTADLSAVCNNAELLLLSRILRVLSSLNYISEGSEPETWLANPTTHAFAIPAIAAGHRFVWDIQVPGTAYAPKFLEETNYACPTSANDGFIQYAHSTKYDVFEYMSRVRPDRLQDFHTFMGNTMGSRYYWVDWYPVQEQILSGYDSSSTLLVDVGGGKGHDILSFADRFPSTGKEEESTPSLILQDLPSALSTISPSSRDPRIHYQAQDFFQPNTVYGARVYFLHHILHDWSEAYALTILKNLKSVMKPGYSKLLIHDLVLPDKGASQFQAAFDMVMMTFNAGIERSRTQWEELLKKAGLRLEGIWHGEGGEDADGIVQAVVDVDLERETEEYRGPGFR